MLHLFVYIFISLHSKLVEGKGCVLFIFVSLVPSMVLSIWQAFAECMSDELFHFRDGTKIRAEV